MKEALKLALEALEKTTDTFLDTDGSHGLLEQETIEQAHKAITAIKEALAGAEGERQPEQEPVANGLPLVIAGAIFDFAGYLTTRDKVIEVGSTANASPVADLVKEWAALRGLSLEDAAVLSWQEWLTPVFTSDTSQERVDEAAKQRHDTTPPQRKPLTDVQREEIAKGWRGRNWTLGDIIGAVEAAHGIKE